MKLDYFLKFKLFFFFLTNRNKCAFANLALFYTPKEVLKIKTGFQVGQQGYITITMIKMADI